MQSFTRRTPAPEINAVVSEYGMLTSPRHATQARIWAIIEPDTGLPTCRAAFNAPSGVVEYEELGLIKSLSVGRSHFSALLTDRSALGPISSNDLPTRADFEALPTTSQAILVIAPCVCGAGPVGLAGPSPHRHHMNLLRQDVYFDTWLTVRS